MYDDKKTTINGYAVELEFEQDGDDTVSSCFVSSGQYSASLAYLEANGHLYDTLGYNNKEVADSVVRRIEDWALRNGY